MDYKKHVEWFFFALLSGSAGMIVNYLGQLTEAMTVMSESVSQLNAKMEVVTTKMLYSEQQILDHESRLRRVEGIRPR